MTRFLHRSLTNEVLLAQAGYRYEGCIAGVVEQQVFNRWKKTKEEVVPVISFDDGWDWIPNLRARRDLCAAWGSDTDLWIGRRMAVYLRPVARAEKNTGRLVEKLEKCIEVLVDEPVPTSGQIE